MHFTKDDKRKIKLVLFVVACSILIYVFITHFPEFWEVIMRVVGILSPFIIALLVSFIVNIPMSFMENTLLKKLPLKDRGRRILAIVLAYLVIVLVLILVFSIFLPQLYTSVRSLVFSIPSLFEDFADFVEGADWLGNLQDPMMETIEKVRSLSLMDYLLDKFGQMNMSGFSDVVGKLVPTINSILSVFVGAFLVLVFSIYMLASKEKLAKNGKELLYSVLPEKVADGCMYVVYTAYDNFYNFFTGQFQEAIILGLMTFIGMKILRMDLALMVSLLVAFGALIPMVGAILAGVLGFFILLSASPVQALGFIAFIVVLQQFDGNLVYPRIVGQSVGLPAIWVLLGVTVGGSVMGVFGMLLFIPIFSTIYDLLGDYKTRKLSHKNIQIALK